MRPENVLDAAVEENNPQDKSTKERRAMEKPIIYVG